MASVRGGRTIYRDDEEDSHHRSYTTVKRYQVPENIARSVHQGAGDDEVDTKIVIKRAERRAPSPQPSRAGGDVEYRVTERVRERDPSPREETDWRFTERVIERERSHDPPARRDVHYRVVERDSDARSIVRVPSPPSPERVTREFRFERERDFSPPRERERPYELEKYSKSTEYFAQPQPIIIRESAPAAPIIIREERREPQKIIIRREEPQYEFIERKEVVEQRDESRSLVKKEESPPPTPAPAPAPASEPAAKPEEDYFYERRVVERRRRSDSYDRRTEIRPRDSASQYSSDGSYEYVRRTTYEDGDRSRSASRSRSRKRELAGGALVGVAAAEVFGHHQRQKGEKSHRGRNAFGGAALGAAGAEAVSRARRSKSVRGFFGRSDSRSRSGERDRDRYDERHDDRYDDRRDRRKHRSRSRSAGGLSRKQTLGSLAAVAAVGALAGYALKNRNKQETVIVNDAPPHRSRSRRRRHSYDDTDIIRPESEARNPDHRNRRIAQAGLASAAAAGIIEKVRSKSRHRSKSRVRTGVPIAAAGLGGAALAGLYEKNKANKEAKKDAIIEDELHRGRGRHSRSRSRSRARGHDNSSYDDGSFDDRSYDERGRGGPGMIAYGNDPIYPDSRRRDYHSDEEPGMYRRRGGSRSSSPDTRRGHSRSRNLAAGAAAAGAAGVAAHEIGRRRERSRVAKENRRRDDDYYGNDREQEEPYGPPPMGGNGYQQAPYGQHQQTYPSSHYFPPPPTGEIARNDGYGGPNAVHAYNPADYAGQPAQQHPYDASYGGYGDSDANLGQPHPGDTHAGDDRHNAPHDYSRPDGRRGRSPENVSASNQSSAGRDSQDGDGVITPRQRSSSRVKFDLGSNTAHSPDASRRKDDAKRDDPDNKRHSDSETRDDGKHRRRKRKGKERNGGKGRESHHQQPLRDHSPSEDSDGTIDLPDRFDEHGNRKHEDPLAQKINELINGQGGAGGLFKALLGGGDDAGGGGGEDEGRSRRRRSRR